MSLEGKYFRNNLDMKKGMEVEKENNPFYIRKEKEDKINFKYDRVINNLKNLDMTEYEKNILIERVEKDRKKEIDGIYFDENEIIGTSKNNLDKNKDSENSFLKELKGNVNSSETIQKSTIDWEQKKKDAIAKNANLDELRRQFDEI